MTVRHLLRHSLLISSLMITGTLSLAPTSASAAGFFEQLFGSPATQSVAPSQNPALPLTSDQPSGDGGYPVDTHRSKRISVQDEKPVLQKPTDLMHDKTLRAGDPVMMKDGIHIYYGPEAGHHSSKQFVSLDAAHVAPKTRNALVAMNTTDRDPLMDAPLREGRSVAGSATALSNDLPISAGYKITDASGKSVRYVGP